uniref:CSON008710 protein n=1 Tax=Culicoides sonorensis TaxID=179676 RepID=A0A336MWV9_CULSO
MDEADDDETVLSGFRKVQEKSSIDGYAEGLSDGRDSVYQQGFDAGYEDGFKFSFLLGQYKALNMSAREFEKTSRGECQVCLNPDLVKENVNDLRKLQQAKNEKRENELQQQFGKIDYEERESKMKEHSKNTKTESKLDF